MEFGTRQSNVFTGPRNQLRVVPDEYQEGCSANDSALYDPPGFLSPFVVRAKILFQDIWKLKLNWKDKLPDHLLAEWKKWFGEAAELYRMHVPRFYGRELSDKATRV